MKHVIVYAPEYRKLQPCDFRNGKSELAEKGHEVRVRDLYESSISIRRFRFHLFSQGNTPADIKEARAYLLG